MFIFLYGEDTYRSSRKLSEIVDGYKKVHKTGLNLIYFDCQDSDFEEFQNSVQSVSMFQEKKLIILRNAFLNTFFKEKFLDWAKPARESENIIIVYENQPVKKIDKLFKFLKANAQAQEFNFFAGVKLQNWVDKEFDKYHAKIDFSARAKLINFVGSDLWQMSQEIRKLSAYARPSSQEIATSGSTPPRNDRGDKLPASSLRGALRYRSAQAPQGDAAISTHDVQLLVIPKIETDIFKTIDAIALNNKKLALLLLSKHLTKGDAPLYLLSMINFQFRNLLIVSSLRGAPSSLSLRGASPTGRSDAAISTRYGAIRIPGMHPYVAQKSIAQARNFTFDKLKKIYRKLLAIDTGIKTGKMNARMALDMFIIQI